MVSLWLKKMTHPTLFHLQQFATFVKYGFISLFFINSKST